MRIDFDMNLFDGSQKISFNDEINRYQYYKGNSVIFICFLGYVLYWYLQGGIRFPLLGSIRFEFLAGMLLSIFAVKEYYINLNKKPSGLGIWVGFLFVIMITMTLFSFNVVTSYNIFIDRVVKFSLFGLFILTFVTSPKRLGFFIAAFLFACFKMGQEGLVGNITGSLIWQNQEIMRLHGSTPNYEHPNSFSGMAIGCIPFVLYLYHVVPRYLRFILLIQFGLMMHIVIFTGSRTGYFGFLGGIIFFILNSKNRKKLFLWVLCTLIVAIPFIPDQYIKRAQTLTPEQEGGEQSGIYLRQQITKDALEIFLANPLGIGVGAFPSIRKYVYNRSQDTHNLYLEIATNIGLQGLVVFFGLIFSIFRILLKLQKDIFLQIKDLNTKEKKIYITDEALEPILDGMRSHVYELQFMLAIVKSVYLFLIIRLFLGVFGHDLYEIYWWFALGITVAVWNMNTVSRNRTHMYCDFLNSSSTTVVDNPPKRG